MSEELVVSTPEDYGKLTNKKMRVPSGAVFHIRAMDAKSAVYMVSIMPETGLKNQKDTLEFCDKHFDELVKHVIKPNIIAPDVEQIMFLDAVELFLALMSFSGSVERSEGKPFRKRKNRVGA